MGGLSQSRPVAPATCKSFQVMHDEIAPLKKFAEIFLQPAAKAALIRELGEDNPGGKRDPNVTLIGLQVSEFLGAIRTVFVNPATKDAALRNSGIKSLLLRGSLLTEDEKTAVRKIFENGQGGQAANLPRVDRRGFRQNNGGGTNGHNGNSGSAPRKYPEYIPRGQDKK